MYYIIEQNLDNEIINRAMKFYIESVETIDQIYCSIFDGENLEFYEGKNCLSAIEVALFNNFNINISFEMKEKYDSFYIGVNEGEGMSFGEATYDASGHLIDRKGRIIGRHHMSPDGSLYNSILQKLTFSNYREISLFIEDVEENRELVFHGSVVEFFASDLINWFRVDHERISKLT